MGFCDNEMNNAQNDRLLSKKQFIPNVSHTTLVGIFKVKSNSK